MWPIQTSDTLNSVRFLQIVRNMHAKDIAFSNIICIFAMSAECLLDFLLQRKSCGFSDRMIFRQLYVVWSIVGILRQMIWPIQIVADLSAIMVIF